MNAKILDWYYNVQEIIMEVGQHYIRHPTKNTQLSADVFIGFNFVSNTHDLHTHTVGNDFVALHMSRFNKFEQFIC